MVRQGSGPFVMVKILYTPVILFDISTAPARAVIRAANYPGINKDAQIMHLDTDTRFHGRVPRVD